MQCSTCVSCILFKIFLYFQIFHVCGDHWIVAVTAPGSKMGYVYNSAYSSLDQLPSKLITGFFVAVPVTLR